MWLIGHWAKQRMRKTEKLLGSQERDQIYLRLAELAADIETAAAEAHAVASQIKRSA